MADLRERRPLLLEETNNNKYLEFKYKMSLGKPVIKNSAMDPEMQNYAIDCAITSLRKGQSDKVSENDYQGGRFYGQKCFRKRDQISMALHCWYAISHYQAETSQHTSLMKLEGTSTSISGKKGSCYSAQ